MQGKYFLDKAICRRASRKVGKSPQVVPGDVETGTGSGTLLRRTNRLLVLAVASVEHRHNRSVTYPWLAVHKWFPTRITERRKEDTKRQRTRAEKRKAKLSCILMQCCSREDEEYNRLISPRCLSEKRRKEQMCSTGREEAELNWATLSALSSCTISGRFAPVNILQCAANALPTLASPVRSIHSGRLVVCLYASPLTPLLP